MQHANYQCLWIHCVFFRPKSEKVTTWSWYYMILWYINILYIQYTFCCMSVDPTVSAPSCQLCGKLSFSQWFPGSLESVDSTIWSVLVRFGHSVSHSVSHSWILLGLLLGLLLICSSPVSTLGQPPDGLLRSKWSSRSPRGETSRLNTSQHVSTHLNTSQL
jgi:hypothetical protein